jgi:hypothetical protein
MAKRAKRGARRGEGSEPSGLSALAGGFTVDPLESLLWGPLRESFGLPAAQWKRLTEVVTLHMVLDALLFLRVTLGLTVVAGPRANVERITGRVNRMRFGARLDLAQDAGWISEELAEDIAAVNGLRNRLLHFDIKRGDAPELASPEAFDAFTKRGVRAWAALRASVQPPIQGRVAQDPSASPS